MQNEQQSIGKWTSCDSRNSLTAQLTPAAYGLLVTDSPNSWGYITFDYDIIIPIGFADMGLLPIAIKHENKIFVGIDEVLAGYDEINSSCIFKYKMPTVFHEFVRFDQDELIVRDEVGFIGISYTGDEHWNYCVGLIATYTIDQKKIVGETEEGEQFEFSIPDEAFSTPTVPN